MESVKVIIHCDAKEKKIIITLHWCHVLLIEMKKSKYGFEFMDLFLPFSITSGSLHFLFLWCVRDLLDNPKDRKPRTIKTRRVVLTSTIWIPSLKNIYGVIHATL